jgi:hypothetical protein
MFTQYICEAGESIPKKKKKTKTTTTTTNTNTNTQGGGWRRGTEKKQTMS